MDVVMLISINITILNWASAVGSPWPSAVVGRRPSASNREVRRVHHPDAGWRRSVRDWPSPSSTPFSDNDLSDRHRHRHLTVTNKGVGMTLCRVSARHDRVGQSRRHLRVGPTCRRHVADINNQGRVRTVGNTVLAGDTVKYQADIQYLGRSVSSRWNSRPLLTSTR